MAVCRGAGRQGHAGEHAGLEQGLAVINLVLQANLDAKGPRSFVGLRNDRDHFTGPSRFRQGGNFDPGRSPDVHEADVVFQDVCLDIDFVQEDNLRDRFPLLHPLPHFGMFCRDIAGEARDNCVFLNLILQLIDDGGLNRNLRFRLRLPIRIRFLHQRIPRLHLPQ